MKDQNEEGAKYQRRFQFVRKAVASEHRWAGFEQITNFTKLQI